MKTNYEYNNHLYIPCNRSQGRFFISGRGFLCCCDPLIEYVSNVSLSDYNYNISDDQILGVVHIIEHIIIPDGYYVKIKMEK